MNPPFLPLTIRAAAFATSATLTFALLSAVASLAVPAAGHGATAPPLQAAHDRAERQPAHNASVAVVATTAP